MKRFKVGLVIELPEGDVRRVERGVSDPIFNWLAWCGGHLIELIAEEMVEYDEEQEEFKVTARR